MGRPLIFIDKQIKRDAGLRGLHIKMEKVT